jgi:hypothetical protein
MRHVRRIEQAVGILTVLWVALALAACAATRNPRESAKPQGFLGDYSQLAPGGDGEADLLYVSSTADWATYDSIIIASVEIWDDPGTEKTTQEEREALASHFYQALEKQLSQDYTIVKEPGPTAMRLRVALTKAEGANFAGVVATGIIPTVRLLSMLGGMAADKATVVGEASVEAELLDSVTGERLAAAVDERWGTKSPTTMFSKWGDVEKACDFWAERIRKRLESLRAGTGLRD